MISAQADATFSFEADNTVIDFGFMDIGQTRALRDRGDYHNQVTCQSDTGNTWYLKIHLVEPLSSGIDTIANKYFTWQVSSVLNGKGLLFHEDEFYPFTMNPELVYTSDQLDNTGNEIKLRFEYRLSIPKSQVPGNYRTTVRYTMTELL